MQATPEVKPGKETTEFKVTKSSHAWAIVGQILGYLITIGSSIGVAFTPESKWGILVGAVIVISSKVKEALVSLGYINSRTRVKEAIGLDLLHKGK